MPVVWTPLVTARGNARVAGSPGPGEVELLRHPGQHVGQSRVGAEVRQQPVAHPTSNLLAVDHDEPDRLAGGDRGAGEPIPLRAAARDRPDVPLDAGILALKSS